MEITFDHEDWRTSALPDSGARDYSRPDWHGLRTRFHASLQARRLLAALRAEGTTIGRGAFNASAARSLTAYGDALETVNPTGLGNRNPGGAKDCRIAGAPHTGDRG